MNSLAYNQIICLEEGYDRNCKILEVTRKVQQYKGYSTIIAAQFGLFTSSICNWMANRYGHRFSQLIGISVNFPVVIVGVLTFIYTSFDQWLLKYWRVWFAIALTFEYFGGGLLFIYSIFHIIMSSLTDSNPTLRANSYIFFQVIYGSCSLIAGQVIKINYYGTYLLYSVIGSFFISSLLLLLFLPETGCKGRIYEPFSQKILIPYKGLFLAFSTKNAKELIKYTDESDYLYLNKRIYNYIQNTKKDKILEEQEPFLIYPIKYNNMDDNNDFDNTINNKLYINYTDDLDSNSKLKQQYKELREMYSDIPIILKSFPKRGNALSLLYGCLTCLSIFNSYYISIFSSYLRGIYKFDDKQVGDALTFGYISRFAVLLVAMQFRRKFKSRSSSLRMVQFFSFIGVLACLGVTITSTKQSLLLSYISVIFFYMPQGCLIAFLRDLLSKEVSTTLQEQLFCGLVTIEIFINLIIGPLTSNIYGYIKNEYAKYVMLIPIPFFILIVLIPFFITESTQDFNNRCGHLFKCKLEEKKVPTI